MKSFEELCATIKRITDNPQNKVDYLKVKDFMQLGQHIKICAPCLALVDKTIANDPHKDTFGFGEINGN